MVLSKRLARMNRVGLNRITKHISGWMPGFGIVIHKGRKSGRTFRTPLNVFRTDDGFVFALTYGPDTDWVKNVVAAGGCELVTRRRHYELVDPRIVHDVTRKHMPRIFVNQILALNDVNDFLYLTTKTKS
jgi:deazaflavin-dependent oxidoreductase (nitroreductase family)